MNFLLLLCFDPVSGHGFPCQGFEITLNGQTTVISTPLDEWSVGHRYLYLTTQTIHKKQASMPPAGFGPAIPASEKPPTDALDCAATGVSSYVYQDYQFTFSAVQLDSFNLKYNYICFTYSLWFPKLKLKYQHLAKLNLKTSDPIRIV